MNHKAASAFVLAVAALVTAGIALMLLPSLLFALWLVWPFVIVLAYRSLREIELSRNIERGRRAAVVAIGFAVFGLASPIVYLLIAPDAFRAA